ncbi:HAD-IB family hydrolase [Streptomyces sp. NPDC006368]|uniref:HAD family hydrolase n=1 Tax=Streptomyces sp. NPDC006368 TaxID=3156760 RepID=UPI0033A87646
MAPPPPATAVAFFDVDETLTTGKTMAGFYGFFLTAVGHGPRERDRLLREAHDLLRPGITREVANRLFYRRLAGYKAEAVEAAGRAWFDRHRERGGFFHRDVVDALAAHRAAGLATVLVSGSFPACLDPIAAHVGADLVLCTRPEVRDGVHTGEVVETMIGAAKERAARALLTEHGIAPQRCHAYGDHPSDLDLLRLVGHPVVVGAHPDLVAEADRNGWRRLPGVPG